MQGDETNGCVIRPLCAFLGVSTKTVVKGIRELREKTCLESDRIRKPGGDGSNSSSHHIVKQDFMRLAERIGLQIVVMHYPPYCSKYNPIEHRLFSQITRSWSGTPILSVADACMRAAETVTKTGLKVFSRVVEKVYETGRKISDGYRKELAKRVLFDTQLHNWNYLINHA